jgi:hypothetical protein
LPRLTKIDIRMMREKGAKEKDKRLAIWLANPRTCTA